MRIFTKLFLLLAGVSAIPLAIAGAVMLTRSQRMQREMLAEVGAAADRTSDVSRRALEDQARRMLHTVVREKGSQLGAFFADIRRAVQLESALVRESLASPPPPAPPPIFKADEIVSLLKDPDGRFARDIHEREPYVTYHLAPDVPQEAVQGSLDRLRLLGHFFAHNQRALPMCMSTYIGHPDGFILGYPGRAPYKPGYDPRLRPWYVKAVQGGRLLWTDLYLDRNGRDMVITCASPVLENGTASPIAVAAIDVKLTEVIARLFDLEGLPVTDAVLVDGEGRVRMSRAYERPSAVALASDSEVDLPTVARFKDGLFAPAWAPGAGDLVSDGVSLFARARIEVVEGGESWSYVVKAPVEAIVASVREVRARIDASQRELAASVDRQVTALWGQVLLIMAGVLALTVIVAWAAARGTSRPLVAMTEVAEKIGRGDLEQRVEVRSRDEVGRMAAAINDMIKGLKERDFVKSTFKRYVASSVVDQLLKEPDKLKLGGEKRIITVFFSDLASFTPVAEKLKPEDLVTLVNQYLGAMTDSIFKSEGTIDKYAGDGIMAFWGAPIEQSDHALRACKAALDNWTALRGLWGDWERRGLPKLEARIGINTGPMVVGNIGSLVKTDYTVMGDAVNLGSRLEGANKAYGTRIMISEATRVAAGDAIVARELDLLAVKGKAQGVRVYELLGLAGAVPEDRVRGCLAYEEGLAAYRARRWDDAERAFRRAIELLGEDKASRVFLDRVAQFRVSSPPADWDGTFALQVK